MRGYQMMRLFGWVVVIELVSMLSGWITKANIPGWYMSLVKSPFNPPQIVFPIVWPILYLLIAIAGWYLWENRARTKSIKPFVFYSIQLLLNWLWTPVFFGLHAVHLGFWLIVLIATFTALAMIFSYRHFKLVTWLLVPYFCWLLFATYLNAYIFLNN